MAWAICTSCGREEHWSATRGARLCDARCRVCGGTLKGKSGRPGRPQPQRVQVVCPICGAKRMHPSRQVLPVPARGWGMRVHDAHIVEVEAGALVCWRHLPLVADPGARPDLFGSWTRVPLGARR